MCVCVCVCCVAGRVVFAYVLLWVFLFVCGCVLFVCYVCLRVGACMFCLCVCVSIIMQPCRSFIVMALTQMPFTAWWAQCSLCGSERFHVQRVVGGLSMLSFSGLRVPVQQPLMMADVKPLVLLPLWLCTTTVINRIGCCCCATICQRIAIYILHPPQCIYTSCKENPGGNPPTNPIPNPN